MSGTSEVKNSGMSNLQSFELSGIGADQNVLQSLAGKVVLLVNVASQCGYTPQYAGLERLHRELCAEGFSVLGVPCNQFGSQEPGNEEEIQRFCRTRFDVTFPMSSKVEVNGTRRHPLYAWLTGPTNGFPGDVEWNFEKFLIGRDGRPRGRYPAGTAPEDNGLMQDIAEALSD